MCVCMYACMYVCMYILMYVPMLCMFVFTYVHMYVCMYVCTYVCMHVCTDVWTYGCMFSLFPFTYFDGFVMYIDVYIYIYIYIYICTCICCYHVLRFDDHKQFEGASRISALFDCGFLPCLVAFCLVSCRCRCQASVVG